MFFLLKISKYIIVTPDQLGPSLYSHIYAKLNQLVGTCNIKWGYLITIFKIETIEDGVVNEHGEAVWTVSFKALVFRPLKGEVLDGVVTELERVGIAVKVGAVKAFIPHTKIPNSMRFSEEQSAFIDENNVTDIIKKGCVVRFKVENVNVQAQEGAAKLTVMGSIGDDYLGY